MTVWQYRPGKWRFEFEHLGKKYGRGGFSTKREARSAEAERRKELKRTLSPAPGDTGFLAAADEYLLLSERKDARKTYKYKSYVFDCFITFAGNVKLRSITPGLVESFLLTRHSNSNANRHRKDLSALFNWAWRRGMMPQNPCLQVEKLREEKRKRAVPSHEEMDRILLAAGEQRPLLLVLYHTMGRVGEILHESWQRKKQLARGVTNERIDRLYQLALEHGAVGGKIAGAGGGGFLLLI
jgi:integrase